MELFILHDAHVYSLLSTSTLVANWLKDISSKTKTPDQLVMGALDVPQVHLLLDIQHFDGHLQHYQKSALTSMNFEAKKTMGNGKYLYMIWLKFTTFLVCKMERLDVHSQANQQEIVSEIHCTLFPNVR
jgi:hypothetical protein